MYLEKFKLWKQNVKEDNDLIKELSLIENNESLIEDAFYKELAFGTGGLRGVIGVGTNRMNIYTVRKASQGLANYVNNNFALEDRRIAISYDSRIKSDVFAKTAAEVFAGNGIKVFIYKQLMPTPCLSYAVRELKCASGIMVTASHNPSKYNGYKVYGSDGCQITSLAAEMITDEINNVDPFENVKTVSFECALKDGQIEYISDDLYTSFIERVKEESVLGNTKVDKNVKIIYSPLHGTGLKPVTRILKETGFNNVIVVKEQELPDGNFTTCPYPNPEIKEAMQLGIEYAKKNNADLLLATDPDCDRVGIAVKDKNGEFVLLTGNQTGVLLFDYICNLRKLNNTMPKNPVGVKTIVTTDMVDKVAEYYGVKEYSVLTGFKYIGDVIANLEKEGHPESYILGFEESYGYLTGTYVRDKDAVDAAYMICEMFAYYKSQNVSLLERLNQLYEKYGYYLNKLSSFQFEGSKGFDKMQEIMSSFRKGISSIGGYKVVKVLDYALGIDGLPKSDVIKFYLDNDSTVVVRPSGTEPKLKLYTSIKAKDESAANEIYQKIYNDLEGLFK